MHSVEGHACGCVQAVTQIVFMTDAGLLKDMEADPLLTAYSVIVVDEVHERSSASDLLLGLLRKVRRPCRPGCDPHPRSTPHPAAPCARERYAHTLRTG